MTETASKTDAKGPGKAAQLKQALKEQPKWKRWALVGAAVCVVLGFVLLGIEGGGESATGSGGQVTSTGGGAPEGASSLLGDNKVILPEGQEIEPPDEETNWAPVFLRFGFSFFVGFAIGTAFRMVLRIALTFVGLFAVAMMALELSGFVTIEWNAMGEAFDQLMGRIGDEAGTVRGLLTGRLPSAGLGMFGLYAGFRRG